MANKTLLGLFVFSAIALLTVGLVSAFPFGNGFGFGMDKEDREQMKSQREAIREAIENGDYEEWKDLMQERIAFMQSKINEETFSKLQEKHEQMMEIREALQNGDFEKAKELKKQHSLEMKFKHGIHNSNFYHEDNQSN